MMNKGLTAYELKIEKIMHLLESLADAFSHGLTHIIKHFVKHSTKAFKTYATTFFQFYTFMRYTTIPYNWLIIKIWQWYVSNPSERKPWMKPGIHYWSSPPRGGKSLTSFILAEWLREKTGYASYFTSPIEKPRLSEDGSYWYVYHRYIHLNRYYKDGKKVLNFNTDKCKSMFKDEKQADQNPRLNKTKEYNSIYIPEHTDDILLAHQGFDNNIHILSQHAKHDSQTMEVVAMNHRIEKTVKGVSYKKWLHDGKFEIVPVYIKVTAYKPEATINEVKLKKYKTYKLKVPYELLPYFDTHAEANRFKHLPKDYN